MITYQDAYFYRRANPDIKGLASRMFIRASSTRDIAYVLSISNQKEETLDFIRLYCAQTKEILALTMEKRSKKTILELYNRLKDIQFWCTGNWEAFKTVFPSEKYKIEKEFTKALKL